jgi:tape measure domain-containing protein
MEGGDLRMSSVDERVVDMKFNNAQFEQAVKQTLTTLDSLNKSLKLEGAAKGFGDISAAASHVQLGTIASGVQSIADKFKALSLVAIGVLTNIANRAVTAGLSFIKSFSVSPIMDGLHEYETQLNAIQTILANTGLTGESGLNKVNAALNNLNHYADKTIYNFSEMARNIGTFTAAGLDLKTSTEAIKGIANLAAISGSSAQQASTAMYQLSQALAAGKVSLEDWNSVVQAGMGGKVFQNALIETAKVHGVAVDKIIKDEGSFRNSLQKGWLTSSILAETLSKFTGDLSDQQLKSMGYTKDQIVAIQKMAQTAQNAATKIKTISQLFDTLKEAMGSGWATTWQTLFGNFNEAETLWTNVGNVLGGFIQKSSNARNKVLSDWKAMGGRTVLIQGISNVFNALIKVISIVRDAFREIFPPTTGKDLYELTVAFRNFTNGLKIGGETADELKRTFAGVFAVLGIGWDIIKGLASVLLHLFGVATSGSGGFLKVTASIGDFLVGVHKAIEDGGILTKFFDGLGKILSLPIKLLQFLGSLIGALFSGFSSASAEKSIDGVTKKLGPLGKLGEIVRAAWSAVFDILDNVWDKISQLAPEFAKFMSTLGSAIGDGLGGINFDDVLNTINTGLFAGLILLVKKFVSKFKGGGEGGGIGSIVDAIKEPFEQLTKTLTAMQNTLRATTLLEIAAAIGIMTISVAALSRIDAGGLTRALTAMTVMFTQLFASMAIFNKVANSGGFAKMGLVTGAMILLAIAVDLLTIAVKQLAGLNWNELAKGLTGVTVLIYGLVGAVRLMPNEGKMISSGLGMIALAGAIKLLASAVTDLSGLSWTEMAKGLIGVGTLLGALTLFTKFSDANKGGVIQGAGIILLATGIKILASAMEDLSGLSWGDIAKGLIVMAGGLAIMGAALDAIPPSSILSAAAILVTAASLSIIGDALQQMGSMSWSAIAKSLVELAGSLAIIAGALFLMEGALPGAAALLVVAASLGMLADALIKMGDMSWGEIAKSLVELAGALIIISAAMIAMIAALPGAAALLIVSASLAILAPILLLFGNMSWESIAKGLLMLAGVFTVIGVAGLLLTPLVPTLIGLGVAITLLGIGIAAAGAGVFLFATGLTALAVAGGAATLALVAMVAGLAGTIPLVMTKLGEGLVAFAKVIATAGPAFTSALVAVLNSLINAIGTETPKIVNTLLKMLSQMLDSMLSYVPHMTNAGLKLLVAVLNVIAAHMGQVVTAGTNVVVAFINGISANIGRVTTAGVNLVVHFVNSLASSIRSHQGAMRSAGLNLALAIVDGMTGGLISAVGRLAASAANLARSALSSAKHALGIASPSKEFYKVGAWSGEGMDNAINDYAPIVAKSAAGMGEGAINSLRSTLSDISDAVGGQIDVKPVISPVLDLTSVKKDADDLASMLAPKSITVDSSYSSAKQAQDGYQDPRPPSDDAGGASGGDTTFIQNNNSPKALSAAEIYRNTKNQLSEAKGALAK